MNTIFHNMTSLKDPLTDRDKTMYFMESLVNKPYQVKKVNLTGTFDKACQDIIDHTSKEKLHETIIKQRHHLHPSNVKVNNLPPVIFTINNVKSKDFDFDSNLVSLWNMRAILRQGPKIVHRSPSPQEFDFDSDQESTEHPAPWLLFT
jgi:hypothetical protein